MTGLDGLDMLIRADLARYAHDQARQNSARRPRTRTQRSALQARSAIEPTSQPRPRRACGGTRRATWASPRRLTPDLSRRPQADAASPGPGRVVIRLNVRSCSITTGRPDQGGERLAVAICEPAGPFGLGEDLLQDEGVDEHERGLEYVHGEHRDLEVFAVFAGELGVLAVVDEVDAAVPGLDDLARFVNLSADCLVGEQVAEVDQDHGR